MGLKSKPLEKVRADVPRVDDADVLGGGMRSGRKKMHPPKAPNETVQIALKLTQGDLDKLDAAAAERRISRAAFIRQAIFNSIAQ